MMVSSYSYCKYIKGLRSIISRLRGSRDFENEGFDVFPALLKPLSSSFRRQFSSRARVWDDEEGK